METKRSLSIFFASLLMIINVAHAQEFFSGTKSPTSTISRTGITSFGFSRIRNNPSNQATILEHTHPEGNLFIRSSNSAAGWVGNVIINDIGGFVGIGTTNPKEKLSVNGTIRAREIKVETSKWPDYVFKAGYDLKPLSEVERYINEHGHLPEIPKASDVAADGVSLGEMNKLLLKKVEELTLYLIEKEKEIEIIKNTLQKMQEQE